MIRTAFIVTISLLCLGRIGFAQSRSDVISSAYAGTYQRSDQPDVWNVTVSFSDRRTNSGGDVELTGTEHFVNVRDGSQNYDCNVRAIVNGTILKFQMTEIISTDTNPYFDPMVYTGDISSDMQTISASWSSGETIAILKLHAIGPGMV
jgi:hypothetical protein